MIKKLNKICISAETTVDLPKNLLEEYDIHTVPFTVIFGNQSGLDGDILPNQIFDYVKENKELPKTSAINEYQYIEYFESLLKEYDCVIHISLSKELSSAYEHALAVSKAMKNVYVIDSRSLSTGIALLCIYASQLAKQGLEVFEIVKKVQERVPYVQTSFVVNTLEYLYKGGRCSALARFGALILRIKPQIIMQNGKLVPGKKYFGKPINVVSSYVNDTLEQFNNPDKSIIFLTHSGASEEVLNEVKTILKQNGFENIIVTVAGATISCHCGPKCLGILYINDGNKAD